ncbi:hypothetical protein Bca52824_088722 [Brassica carinata]|uniref:Cytochrome P450 n=1 Tax=Brassica carinata TaxID=52824 RepID=A0A8X7PAQ4_BRACI|nr:hypothetical protein Bca52824_088722 [Brassica carinata]
MRIKKSFQSYPWNWPVLGMLPAVLMRLGNSNNDIIWVLEKNNLTFIFRGPWFTRLHGLITVDPANIHHVLSSNFSNYIKGPKFKEYFDVFGDGIFNADTELWKNLRMSSQTVLNHQGFQNLSMSVTTSKLKDVILPLFSRFSEDGTVMDLQDVFRRLMFDISLVTITGSDPQSLSIEMPEVEFAKAFDNAGEAILFRHIIPRFLWELQKRMGLGKEKKLTEAGSTFDRICTRYIFAKREEKRSTENDHDHSNGERRDSTSSALTWFFGLLSRNPHVEAKIRQEIKKNLPIAGTSQEGPWSAIDHKEFLNKLVYLHGALYETMRLYPPVPFERKSPIKSDVLPSGHKIDANSHVIIPIYALGRMRSLVKGHKIEPKPRLILHMKHGLRVTLTKRGSA